MDSGGNVSDLVVARNCCMARTEKPSWCRNEQVCRGGGGGKSVKRFERSNGLDTALYKNYLYLYYFRVGVLTFHNTNYQHNIHDTIATKMMVMMVIMIMINMLIAPEASL